MLRCAAEEGQAASLLTADIAAPPTPATIAAYALAQDRTGPQPAPRETGHSTKEYWLRLRLAIQWHECRSATEKVYGSAALPKINSVVEPAHLMHSSS